MRSFVRSSAPKTPNVKIKCPRDFESWNNNLRTAVTILRDFVFKFERLSVVMRILWGSV